MKLRELMERATKEWRLKKCPNGGAIVDMGGTNQVQIYPEHDAALIVAAVNLLPELLAVVEIAETRPNKMGPHYMIWMSKMDAALAALREKEKTT